MKKQSRYIVVYLLLAMTALFLNAHETVAVPVNKPLKDIPMYLDEWTMTAESRFDPNTLKALKPTDYLYRVYRNPEGNMATLYLGYHAGGPESGPIHSPKHCLPGSGWFELSEVRRKIQVANEELPLVEAVYQHDDQKQMFLYYYQVKGRALTDEYSLKIAEITNSILYNRRDSAFIRISVQYYGENSVAAAVGEDFLKKVYPHIASALPL